MLHQRRLDGLFVQIGRDEARARKLARDLGSHPDVQPLRDALADVADKLEETWRILSDKGYVR